MSIASLPEVQKNFGHYQDVACAAPVVATQYGKPTVFIPSTSDYEWLKELDHPVLRLNRSSDDEITEVIQAEIPTEHRYSLAEIPD